MALARPDAAREPTGHRRAYFPLPAWEAVSSDIRRLADAAERRRRALSDSDGDRLRQWLAAQESEGLTDSSAPELRHRLSDHVLTRPLRRLRSLGEWARLPEAREGLPPALAGEGEFPDFIAGLATRLVGRATEMRTVEVRTALDAAGRFVIFPSPCGIPDRLEEIRSYLLRSQAPPVFRAAVALVAILNCHPFRDGNGRTARLLFNACLQAEGPAPAYVPLYEFAAMAHGGFEIRMRLAELRGDWSELLGFIDQALRLVATGGYRNAA